MILIHPPIRNHILIALFLLITYSSFAQKQKKFTFQPIIFSSPETSLAFGGIGLYKKKNPEYGYVTTVLGFATYSINNQINFKIVPDLFLNKGGYRFKSELSYKRRVNLFWGIGNQSPNRNKEEVQHQSFHLKITPYRTITKNLYLGISYDLFNTFDVSLEEATFFNLNDYSISGIGPSLLFDNRKNIINPYKGWYVEINSLRFLKEIGSEFNFNRYQLDVRHYIKLNKKLNHILAFQSTLEINNGDVPWNSLAQLGGISLRGYFKGRFRDKNLVTFQSEYRSPLIFWRVSMVAFVGGGYVSSNSNTSKLHPSLGGGLRVMLDKKDRLNLRFDYAIGEQRNSGLYFGIRESF